MSGETEQQVSGWTVDTLKAYFEQRFRDQEKAVAKYAEDSEKWRQNANEWRGAMNDRERSLMPRAEAENSSQANADKIAALAARIDKNEGRTSGLMAIFLIVSAVGVLVAIFIALRA